MVICCHRLEIDEIIAKTSLCQIKCMKFNGEHVLNCEREPCGFEGRTSLRPKSGIIVNIEQHNLVEILSMYTNRVDIIETEDNRC